jgi:hypothetical protein
MRISMLAAAFAFFAPLAFAQSFNEYQVKAVYLYHFSQFVEWPANANNAPFVICVLGDDPFAGSLEDTVRGETVNSRPFDVQRFRNVDEISACNILFVSHSETDQLQKILARVKGRDILTVSDTKDFARRGGIVQFVTDQKKVRLRINVEAAKTANITISSKLLRPAEIVSSDSG